MWRRHEEKKIINNNMVGVDHGGKEMIDILFSGTQSAVLPIRIEQGIKEHIFKANPQARTDAAFQVLLTYQIQGSYYAYAHNRKDLGDEKVLDILDKIASHMNSLAI